MVALPMSPSGFGYAPPLLPDELFYSWLGRFSLLNALGTSRECAKQIFGSRTIIPGIDLPTHLQSVQRRLGEWLPFRNIDQLLDFGTLLPYHRPFLTKNRYNNILQILLQGDGKGLKTQIGRVANRFGANPPLRFCAKCVAESIESHGSPYWVRQHQLPGVNCCTRHRIQLQHQLPLHLRTNRQQFVIPTNWTTSQTQVKASDWQLRFAKLSEDFLYAALPVIDAQQRATIYRHAALKMGFKTDHDRVDYKELTEAVRHQFEDFRCFEHRERLLATSVNPLSWIKPLIERPLRSCHPICHLLLIEFLFGSISSFVEACSRHQINVLTCTPSQQTSTFPTPLEILSDIDSEAVLRDISLSCRQVASLIGKSVTTVVVQRRARGIAISERRKSLSDANIEKIRAELRSGDQLPSVAARSGVSLSTIYRVLAQYPSSRGPDKFQDSQAEATERRQRWLSTLSAHKHAGVNAIRTAAPADYAWLYRHDRTWLMSTTQSIHTKHESGPRVDWAQRDAYLSQLTLAYAAALHKQAPPKRITKTQLLRPLGEAMVRKNMNHLPLLRASLNRVSESHEAFRVRRVDFAIAALANSAPDIQVWRVKRLAGIRLWSATLSAHIHQEVDRLNAQNSIYTGSIP